MTANHPLAGFVRSNPAEELPEQHPVRLLGQVQLRVQAGMHEDVVLSFEVSGRAFEKRPVGLGDGGGKVLERIRPVRQKRFAAAATAPTVGVGKAASGAEHHDFVIASEKYR